MQGMKGIRMDRHDVLPAEVWPTQPDLSKLAQEAEATKGCVPRGSPQNI